MATKLRYPKGTQFFTNAGAPLAGGKLRYERAGTSTLLTTYSNADGTIPNTQVSNRIVLNAFGRLTEAVYLGDQYDAKETLYDANDVVIAPWPEDNIPKAIDFSASELGASPPLIEWIEITSAQSPYNLSASNTGKGLSVNATGGAVTINLPIAANLDNGEVVVVKKTAGANTVTIVPNGSETVDGATNLVLTKLNRSVILITDGAGWFIGGERLEDSLSYADFNEVTAPAAPGADKVRVYAVEVGGKTQLAIKRENGPQEILAREGLSPGAILAIIEDQKAQGTAGGSFVSGADRTRDLNTLVYNRGSLVSLASNQFTLPAGTWEIEWSMPAFAVDRYQSLLYDVTDSVVVKRGSTELADNPSGARDATRSFGSTVVTLAASKAFEIRGRCASTQSTEGFGRAANHGVEVYTRVVVRYA